MATATQSAPHAGGKASEVELNMVDLDQIHVDEKLNSRKDYNPEEMQDLENAIQNNGGIWQPLVICPTKPGVKSDKPYVLIAGFRRAKALRNIATRLGDANGQPGWSFSHQIPVMIAQDVDVSDYHVIQLVENLVRSDLNPIESGDAIELALEESKVDGKPTLTARALAQQIGVSEGKVSQLRKIAGLPPFVKDLISKKEISFTNARILADLVPPKHYKQAAKLAKELTPTDFEARVRKNWGEATAEAAAAVQAGGAGAPKPRKTRPPKEVTDLYLPEIRGRAERATDPAEKQKYSHWADGILWMLNTEGTELGRSLADFEAKRNEEEQKKEAEQEKEKGAKRLLNTALSVMNKHLNKEVGFGETRPTPADALAVVKKSLEKDYNDKDKTIRVAAGKAEAGKEQQFVSVPVKGMDEFLQDLHQAWTKQQSERKAAAQKRKDDLAKKKAEEDAKKAAVEAEVKANQQALAAQSVAQTGGVENVANNTDAEKVAQAGHQG